MKGRHFTKAALLGTLLGLTQLLLATAQTLDGSTFSITTAHLLPDDDGGVASPDGQTELYIELSEDVDVADFNLTANEDFLCDQFLQVFRVGANGEKISLLPRANCRFCAEEGLFPTQGILILPQIAGLNDEGFVEEDNGLDEGEGPIISPPPPETTDGFGRQQEEETPVFIQFNTDSEDAPVQVEVLPAAPTLISSGIVTDTSFGIEFSDPIVAIRGERFLSTFTTICSNVFFLPIAQIDEFPVVRSTQQPIVPLCSFNFDVINNGVLIKVEDNTINLQNSFADFTEDSFYGAEEKFGIKPVSLNGIEFGFLPSLSNAQFDSNFTLTLFFERQMEQRNEDRFLCSDLFTYEVFNPSTESEIEIWGERDDLFCALRWIDSNTVKLEFTDFVPFLIDGTLGVKQLPPEALTSGVPTIRGIDGFGLVLESTVSVFINEEFYDAIQFSVARPNELTRCDKKFDVQIDQISGPPLLVDFQFSVVVTEDGGEIPLEFSVDNNCLTGGTLLFCNTFDTTATPLQGVSNIFYDIGINGFPFISENFEQRIEKYSTPGESIRQNIVDLKIPLAVSGVNSQNPSVSVERGTSFQLRGELGDAFGCVGNVQTEQLVFAWNIDNEGEESVFNQTGRKTINIGGTALPPGIFTATFSASLPAGSLLELQANSISFDLIVTAAPAVAVSAVGDSLLVSSVAGLVVLDASTSCNPNEIVDCSKEFGIGDAGLLGDINDDASLREATGFDDSFTLTWSCDDCGPFNDSDIFEGVDPNRMVVPLDLSRLDLSGLGSLSFKFTISKDNDVSSFSVQANIFEDKPDCLVPKISIASVGQKVNVESSLTIFGSVEGFSTNPEESEIDDISWSLATTAASVSPPLDDLNTLQREKLFIPPNTLVEGETYTFRLSAIPACAVGDNAISLAFAELSFATNRRPTGGDLIVSPTRGLAVTDIFTLTAANWKDADGDTPLEYAFEIAFVANELVGSITEIGAQQATILRSFTPSNTFQTTLPLPPAGFTMFLISLARDSLGSVSRRIISTTRSDVIVENPFENNGVVNVDINLLIGLIDDLSNTGDKAEIPTLCTAISSALNDFNLNEEELAEFGDDLRKARQLCLDSVGDTLDDLDADEVDVDLINLVANSVKEISGGTDDADETLLADIDSQTRNLIDLANEKVKEAQRSAQDPTAGSLLPDSFRDNIINSVSNALLITDNLLGDSQTIDIPERTNGRSLRRYRRRLQGQVSKCTVVGSARSNIETLANVQNSFVVAGAPPVDAESNQVRFAAVRESFNEIGEKTKNINVPGGLNDVTLPSGFAGDVLATNDGLNRDADVNVLATKWNFAIRCEERKPDPLVCEDTYTYVAPLPGKEGPIVAVDFFPFEGETDKSLVVQNLSQPIVIILDAPEDISDDDELNNSTNECLDNLSEKSEEDQFRETVATASFLPICGFFDEDLGDFSTEGCVTETLSDGRIKCSCVHATDYAAWTAFKYDVAHTFKDQIVLTPLAKRFIFTFFPIVFGLGIILFIWAVKADKRDSKNILKAALARLKLFRVINRRKKLQFFDNYEFAKLEKVMGDQDKILAESAKYNDQLNKPKHAGWCLQFYLAIKYEHSVIGINRYDPNFSRVQRVAVFFAVVISNFGAAALVYELRSDTYEISILVTVAVSFISAFLVSIPVKLMVKLLFKATSNFIGSGHDMVNNMYRVLSRVEKADGVESPEDKELVDAIHVYMDVERKIDLATKKKTKYSSGRGTTLKGTTLKRSTTRPGSEEDGDEGGDSIVEEAQLVDEADIVDADELLIAKQLFQEAKSKLKIATVSARVYWGEAEPEDKSGKGLVSKPLVRTFYTSWDKIKSSRRQPSGFLRFAAVVGEDPAPVARHRAPWLPSQLVFFNWVALFVVVGFYSFYIVKFIGTRSERADNPPQELLDAGFDPITEGQYLEQWIIGGLGGIIVSYVIAEPLIALFRYVLLPMIVSKFGKDVQHFDELEIKNAKVDPENKDKNIREGYAHGGFDLAADVIESLF